MQQTTGRSSFPGAGNLLLGLALSLLLLGCNRQVAQTTPVAKGIRYVPIGDSYTAGVRIDAQAAWPALLAADLSRNGIATQLVVNPAGEGWTTQQAIEKELPIFEASRPEFATLLIGANDWAQKVDAPTFRKHLTVLMDRMQAALPDKSRLLVLTIPAFFVTKRGTMYMMQREGAASTLDLKAVRKKTVAEVGAFNKIIIQEAHRRGLKVVDLYPASLKMEGDASRVAADDLHPSAKEHANWEKLIYPVASNLLKQKPASVKGKPVKGK